MSVGTNGKRSKMEAMFSPARTGAYSAGDTSNLLLDFGGTNRLPKRIILSWISEPRVAGGQEMTCGRSLQRHLAHFNLPTAFTEWAPLAQDRAG